MGTTTFSGPVKAGTISNTTGTTVGTDMKNVGFTLMSQSAAITQSTTAAASGIIIPANSQIVECYVYVTTAYDNSATLSIGTSSTSTELCTAVAVNAPLDRSRDVVCAITTWPVFFILVPTVVPVVFEIGPAFIGPENVVVPILILLVCESSL